MCANWVYLMHFSFDIIGFYLYEINKPLVGKESNAYVYNLHTCYVEGPLQRKGGSSFIKRFPNRTWISVNFW